MEPSANRDQQLPSSTWSAPVPAPSAFCETVASATGCETGLVSHIVEGIHCSMRSRQKTDAPLLLTELALELEYCAKGLVGAVKTEELVLDELVEFACARFGHLGVREIREAFRLAAAGALGEINLRAYYGHFTVAMLGEVLGRYNQYRRPVVASVVRMEEAQVHQTKELDKKANWDPETWELTRMAKLRSLPAPNLESVTALDYELLTRRGLLRLQLNEKRGLLEKAGAYLQAELSVRVKDLPFGENVSLRAMLERVQAGGTDPTFDVQQVAYAKRMAVLEWLEQERSAGA